MISKRRLLNRISMLEFDVEQMRIEFDIISENNKFCFNELQKSLERALKCPSKYYVGKQDCKYGTVINVEPSSYYKQTDEIGRCTLTNKFLSYKITFDKDGVITVITEKTKLKL